MNNPNIKWSTFNFYARDAAEHALVAYWMHTRNSECHEMHAAQAIDNLEKAAALLGFDLVKRQQEAA